jgi:hypothetical protein
MSPSRPPAEASGWPPAGRERRVTGPIARVGHTARFAPYKPARRSQTGLTQNRGEYRRIVRKPVSADAEMKELAMNQEWFEMHDVRQRRLNTAVWIPLRASRSASSGESGKLGHKDEFFGATSIAVPVHQKAQAETLDWMSIGLRHSHCGYVEGGLYKPADEFEGYGRDLSAVALALEQDGNSDEFSEWHLHQDLAITLKLKREGDNWLAMNEAYIEVARLKRDERGGPILLEIRAEFLKDYLCARGMALFVSSYRSRQEILADSTNINWADEPFRQVSGGDRWEGRRTEIVEGGHLFGSSAAVLWLGRENVDAEQDVPTIAPTDANLVSKSWTKNFEGTKLVRIQGELWRSEWVEPASNSPRVRGDELPASVFFVTDAEGRRQAGDALEATGGWLWFRPDSIVAVSSTRGGGLTWYTRDTGGVKGSPGSYLDFGINSVGLVNVYAKDIGNLAEWKQRIWAGFNVSPEGGVSSELLAAQANGIPADTQAPEAFLPKAFGLLNEATNARFQFRLFREHADFESLIAVTHRFRATGQAGLFSLAKDLARLTADSIDGSAIQKIVQPPKGEKWGSLKSLEKLMGTVVEAGQARSLLSPLVGVYELRLADAHLVGSEVDEAFQLARVDRSKPFVLQGFDLLDSCVSALCALLRVLNKGAEACAPLVSGEGS